MHLVHMRPEQIHGAVQRNVPALAAAGVMEYHGPHLPVGTDFLIAQTVCEAVEKRVECVLLPAFTYGPTLSWASDARDGEIDFEPEALFVYGREVLRRIAAIGFRRIYILQHHQGPEGLQTLCLKRAAMEVVRETTSSWGAGWGKIPNHELPNPDIFSWIQVAHIDSYSTYPSAEAGRIPIGHGGKGETQLILATLPETVRMQALSNLENLPEWLQDSRDAKVEEGEYWLEFCIRGWAGELARGTIPPQVDA